MSEQASILIADDEDSFRESTSRLLRQEGFECHGAANTDEALENLRNKRYDVLLADIRMPQNLDLQLVQEANQLDHEMAIILITGYPTTKTAIKSVELPVKAYLTKPLDFSDLLEHINAAVQVSQKRRSLASTIERLRSVITDLETAQSRELSDGEEADAVTLETVRTLATCLMQVMGLAIRSRRELNLMNLCDLVDCPNNTKHRDAIVETVEVLKSTKDLFKSKVLARLRQRLEDLLNH